MYNTRVDGTPSDPRETKKVRNFGVIQIDSRADVRVQMGTKPAKVWPNAPRDPRACPRGRPTPLNQAVSPRPKTFFCEKVFAPRADQSC